MGWQIENSSIVETPKQRNTKEEKADIKAIRIPEEWNGKPNKLQQKDCDAHWTLKRGRVRVDEDGREQEELLIPAFGYKVCPRACPGEPCQHRSLQWYLLADEGNGCGGAR